MVEAYPLELRSDPERAVLEVAWTGSTASLGYDLLRRMCPCASCTAVRRSGRPIEARAVTLTAVEPFGANAVRLSFSDGHARGIYPFAYFRELALQDHGAR
jgi:DUF971 family protein